jgi:uncharacterized membrane protein
MKFLLGLLIGIALGAAGFWVLGSSEGRARLRAAGHQLNSTAASARDTVQDKLRILDLHADDIRDDLARTGKVVRRKAREAGQTIADATVDARTTAAIKAKFLASRELSALSISVNTTAGIVTLSGTVSSAESIGKAVLLAMETDGVREVISTLQIRPTQQPARHGV